MNFDALDYFQAQKAQERAAVNLLDEARTSVSRSRAKLEQAELAVMGKKKQASDARKKLAALCSSSILGEQVDLVKSRTDLALAVEKQTLERVGKVQELLHQLEEPSFSSESENEDAGEDQKEFQASMTFMDATRKRIQALREAKNDLSEQLQTIKSKTALAEEECHAWEAKLKGANGQISSFKDEIGRTRERVQSLQQDTERSIASADSLWREKLENARKELLETAKELQDQAERVLVEDGQELVRLREAIKVCEDQKLLLEAEKAKLDDKLKSYASDPLLSCPDPAAVPELQALRQRLDEERENVRLMREALKPQKVLWEDRQKVEEARFLPMNATLIDPKRDELLALKRGLREAEETNVKMQEKYQKLMEELDVELSEAQSKH